VRRLIQAVAVMLVVAGSVVPAASAGAVGVTGGSYCSVSLPEPTYVCADSPSALASVQSAGSRLAATQFLIARLYDNSNFDTSAGYLNVYAAGDCTLSTGNIDYTMNDLSTWSNRVSSFESFGNCAARLWTATNYAGSAYPSTSTFLVSSSYVGATFNDKAKSAQFS
jgi:hypothetical protein